MNCGHEGHHHGRHGKGRHGGGCGCGQHHGGDCGRGGSGHFGRRFWTREEKIARLEKYLENLQAEAKAVEEHIVELKGE